MPLRPSCIIRATALEPPPPTPTTLIFVPNSASSSIKNFKSSAILCALFSLRNCLLQNQTGQPRRCPFPFALQPKASAIHGQTGRRRPHWIVQFLRPFIDAKRKSVV